MGCLQSEHLFQLLELFRDRRDEGGEGDVLEEHGEDQLRREVPPEGLAVVVSAVLLGHGGDEEVHEQLLQHRVPLRSCAHTRRIAATFF